MVHMLLLLLGMAVEVGGHIEQKQAWWRQKRVGESKSLVGREE